MKIALAAAALIVLSTPVLAQGAMSQVTGQAASQAANAVTEATKKQTDNAEAAKPVMPPAAAEVAKPDVKGAMPVPPPK